MAEEEPAQRALSYADGGPAPPQPTNLWRDWLAPAMTRQRDSPALASLHQPAHHLAALCGGSSNAQADHLHWTHAQLSTATARAALALAAHGLRAADAVAAFVWNSAEWAVLFGAALRLGAVFVPLDPRALDARPRELASVLGAVAPAVVVVAGAADAARYDAHATEGEGGARLKIACEAEGDETLPEGWVTLEAFVAAESVAAEEEEEELKRRLADAGAGGDATAAEDIATVLFTSGTTNAPKGVPLRVGQLALMADGYVRQPLAAFDASAKFVVTTLCFRPVFFMGVLATWRVGGCVVMPNTGVFDAETALRVICEHHCTHLFIVATQLYSMAECEAIGRFPPRTVKFVNVTGDVTNAATLNMCRDALGAAAAASVWGMTEGVGVLGWEQKDDRLTFGHGQVSGVGRVMAGGKVRISEAEERRSVKRGETGELHVSGPMMVSGYLGGRSAESFYEDKEGRWFITGDRATMDNDGVVYVLGRSKDVIVREGVNLIPSVIEACLNEGENIESQVVALPHRTQGEVPIAIIKATGSGDSSVSKEKLADKVAQQLGVENVPEKIYLLEELNMSDWPVNATGKILKTELRETAAWLHKWFM